jgi:hypothetical protein
MNGTELTARFHINNLCLGTTGTREVELNFELKLI